VSKIVPRVLFRRQSGEFREAFANTANRIDNDAMQQDPWQQRVERANELAMLYSFATDVLHFYVQIAGFQRDLYLRLLRFSNGSPGDTSPPELSELLASFPEFLRRVERYAPNPLREFASSQLAAAPSVHAEFLNSFWTAVPAPDGLQEFTARAFLQPYAEFARSRIEMQLEDYNQSLCPFCSRKPGFGVLRQQGDGGRRSLMCSFCLAEWQFRRILCPGCGEQDHKKLPVYTAAELVHVRVECCDTCQSYLKTVDLTRNGLAVPLVDELAAIPLDLWAQERGYQKLQPNLMQM
jgi:formate dehydrogenase maturation protein FdhE